MTYEDSIKKLIGNVYCPTCRNEKFNNFSINKTTIFDDCKNCKTFCYVLNIPFKDQKMTVMFFGGVSTHFFARKTSRDYENEKPSPFLKKFLHESVPITVTHTKKRLKGVQTWKRRIRFLLVDDLSDTFIS